MKKILVMVSIVALSSAAWAATAQKPATAGKPDASYPMTTCLVSGEALEGGDMGGPVKFSYEGRDVWFCCPHCKKDFLKDPAKYLKVLDDAAAKAKAAATATAPAK